tara:strand:+ start:186 stop:371 length:186 start_codon:yes stop_codon:yes gene_type:complete
MKAFEVINKENCSENIWGEKDCPTVTVIIHEPPYTDDEILRKIKWNRSKVEIIDVTPKEIS